MKKTIKQTLSTIIAVMLILSVVPMAFAADECEHVFNTETLVRPFDESYNPVADPHFYCSACGEKVPVKPADFSEYFKTLGMAAGYIDSVYMEENAADVMGDYFAQCYPCDNVDGIVFYYTEYEQDIVDAYTAEVLEYVAGAPAVIGENGLNLILDATVIFAAQWYMQWGMEFLGEEPIMKVFNAIEDFMIEFEETVVSRLSEIVTMNPADITPEIVAEYDILTVEYAAFYFDFVNCARGIHSVTEATDNGDGTHTGICDFCSEEVTEEHTAETSCDCCDFFVEDDNTENEGTDNEDTGNNDSDITDEENDEKLTFEEIIEKWIEVLKDFFALIKSFVESIF